MRDLDKDCELGLGIWIRIRDWGLGLGICMRIGDLGFKLGIGHWNC